MKALDEKITLLEKKLSEARAQKKLADARLKSKTEKQNRANDTRRKILLGAIVIKHSSEQPEFEKWLRKLLDTELTRDNDRELFNLKPNVISAS